MKKHLYLMAFLLAAIVPSAWAYQLGPVDFHGFLDAGYMKSNGNNYFGMTKDGDFHFTDIALNFGVNPTDKLHIGGQLIAFREGAISALNIPEIDWLYADYQWQDWLGFRIGKVKAPFGLYGEALDVQMARPFIFLPQGVYNTDYWTDSMTAITGVAIYGNIPLYKKLGSIDYNVELGKSNIRDHSGLLLQYADYSLIETGHYHNDMTFNTQLIWNTPMNGLRLLWSYMYVGNEKYTGSFKTADALGMLPGVDPLDYAGLYGNAAHYGDWESAWTVGGEYSWKSWTFAAEYARSMYRTVTAVEGASDPSLTGDEGSYSTNDAWYVSAAYRVNPKLQLATYYSLNYLMMHDHNGRSFSEAGTLGYSAFQKDFALTVRYDVTPWWILKVEGHVINGTKDLLLQQNQPWQNEDRYWLFGAVKTIFYF